MVPNRVPNRFPSVPNKVPNRVPNRVLALSCCELWGCGYTATVDRLLALWNVQKERLAIVKLKTTFLSAFHHHFKHLIVTLGTLSVSVSSFCLSFQDGWQLPRDRCIR